MKVRKMKKMKIFDSVVAIIATFFTYLFGGWDVALSILITFMILDYITGVIWAYIQKNLNSEVGFKGLVKKCTILIVLIVGSMLDRLLNSGEWVFRTLVAYFYIANEGISLLENISNLGVPIPAKIKDALEQLNNKEESEKQE
nr:MAG TPA: holin [Caudoviricetes sp.]